MTEVHILVGKTIRAVHLAEDKLAIKFDIEDGDPIVAKCDADCCSYTWIENIENVNAIIGSPVTKAENIDMPDLGNMPDREVVAYYGFKIETARGTCIIDYRNDSNGYYGGDLSWPPSDRFYGGVYGQNFSKEEWKQIAPEQS